jgi:peptidoglycan/xylan/chitin deacetylase (PgdA/CDA1 family)
MNKIIILSILSNITLIKSQVFTSCINNKHISLTFDDGPRANTANILRILDLYNIKATFFINAIHILRNPSMENLVKRMYNNGHVIGTHGFSHGEMTSITDFNKQRELYDNELLFRKLFNQRPYFYRPPYYSYDNNIINLVNSFGYITVTSNIDTNDWKATNSSFILNNFKTLLVNSTYGYITLQHDHQLLNNQILRQMINYALQNNYIFVPLDVCLQTNKRYQSDYMYSPNLDFGINLK